MQTKQKPTCGRVVHVVAQDQSGANVHRAMMVCDVTGEMNDNAGAGGLDWVISGHVMIKPGDQIGGMWAMTPTAGGVASVPFLFLSNVAPGTTAGTWHWPEREEVATNA